MRQGKVDGLITSWRIDRREFVKIAASIGVGTVATAVLGGCTQETQSSSGVSGQESGTTESNGQDASTVTTGSEIKTDRSTPGAVKVYATRSITPEGLVAVYDALGWEPTGNVGIKLHMGEEGNPYYLQPELLEQLVEKVDGTFIDSTVLYGRRSTADGYASLAREHGFTYAPVDILDRDGGVALPIEGGSQLSEAEVGSHFANYDSIISIAHFKGHAMAGFGGTFKNLAIGLATIPGKMSVHTSSFSTGAPFVERVAEFAKGVFDAMGDRMACINVLNNLSVDCDCDDSPEAPAMGDIGIMASLDPVALDQASVDQVYLSDDPGKQAVIDRIESRDGIHLLEYAEELGIGSRAYELVAID
ncbi:MAG: DUF362 domain-containing protein [Coriobacteriales bacterium]